MKPQWGKIFKYEIYNVLSSNRCGGGMEFPEVSPSVELLPWADGTSIAVEDTVLLSNNEGVVDGLEGSTDSVVDDGELLPWADGDSVGGHSLATSLAGSPSSVGGLEGDNVSTVGVDGEFLPWSDGTSVGEHTVS